MKRRILLIVNTLSSGGAERTAAVLTRKLKDTYAADIMVNSADRIDYEYEGRIISLGIRDVKDRTGLSYQLKAFMKRLSMLKILRKKEDYAAVISFSDSANVSNVLTKKYGGKTVISFRNLISEKSKSLKYRLTVVPLGRLLYRRADERAAVSGAVKREAESIYALENVKVIENGIDLESFKNIPDTVPEAVEEFMKDRKCIVTMGRLNPQKNQKMLVRAFSKTSKAVPEAALLILGEGSERESLEETVDSLDLKSKVMMPGFVKNPYGIVKKADVFAFTSLFEGYSNALLEAVGLGKCTVSTAHESGALEILSGKTEAVTDAAVYADYGILVPNPLNAEESRAEEVLADVLINVLTDDELKTGYEKRAVKRAEMLDINEKILLWKKIIES